MMRGTIQLDFELCSDCGEMLVKGAATEFVLVVKEGKVTKAYCWPCFNDRVTKTLIEIGGEAAVAVLDRVRK